MAVKSPNPKAGIVGFVVLIVILRAAETFRENFVERLGFRGGLIVATLFTAILVLAICLLAKVAWRKAVAYALMIPLTLNAFEGVRWALEPHVGSVSAFAVGGVSAVTLGLLAGFLATHILGIRWDEMHANDADA